MGLKLYLGGAGYGKSYRMYQEMIEKSIRHPDKNYIIVVPEQYTMQTQKNIVKLHPNHGISNIDVVSFGRLAYRVFDEVGGFDKKILEDTGKRMVIRKVLEQKSPELTVFRGNLRKTGFSGELKSMISELLQYNISSEQLTLCQEQLQKKLFLKDKIHDLRVVYDGFKDYIREHYLTAEEILVHLGLVIGRSQLIRNSEIYLDEFTGFTPAQYHLLGELLTLSKAVTVALTVDPQADPYNLRNNYELFYLTKETIFKLEKLCGQQRIERREDVVITEKNPRRFMERADLTALEAGIFRMKPQIYKEKPKNLKLYTAADPGEEVRFIARKILTLVREGGYRFRDIAVITGDLAGYRHTAEMIFETMGIPSFIDLKRSIINNGLVEMLRSVLEMYSAGFSYESVFRYLRTGLSGLVTEDVDLLENYVRAAGIRGLSRWRHTFKRRYRGFTEDQLLLVNQIRERLMTSLEPITEVFGAGSHSVLKCVQNIKAWMTARAAEQQILAFSEQFELQGQLSKANEYIQIYPVVVDILDKFSDILGEECLNAREFRDILDAGLEEEKLGLIPPGVDQVIIGDIKRTRLNDIKVLFFIGVNEGIVPAPAKEGGLITDHEKSLLSELDIELSPTVRQMSFMEQFYLYSVLTKASHQLILSYCRAGVQGKALRPSSLIHKIMALFPALSAEQCELEGDLMHALIHPSEARRQMIKGFHTFRESAVTDEWKQLFGWFRSHEGAATERLLEAAFLFYASQPLSMAAIRSVYGAELNNSVTTLEQYASCAYAHFLSYGLRLREREENQIEDPDLGLIFHSALEAFSRRLENSEYTWINMPDAERERLSAECVRKAAEEFHHTILLENARNRHLITRMERMVIRTTWALQKQLQRGKFTPAAYELRFDSDGLSDLSYVRSLDAGEIKLKGTIDRMDLYEDEANVYVKVVDYKSGIQKFDVVALYYGLQLQLVIYMNAAMAVAQAAHPEKTIIPAGLLYYHIDDPIMENEDIKTPAPTREILETELLKKLKMDGIINADENVIRLMDQEFTQNSDVIPVALNKDGSISKRSGAVTRDQFVDLSAFVNLKIENLGQGILDGNIDVNPYQQGKKNACTYCRYKPICGFDEGISGFSYRRLSQLSAEGAWAQIREEAAGHGDEMDSGTTTGH